METIENNIINNILKKLSSSNFRASFKLKDVDKEYINKKGIEKIREHASEFVLKRLSSDIIPNDGKQTPMRGHPVFIAQHATATCCRGCLYKWHNIKLNKCLSIKEQEYIVEVIMVWIKNQMR